VILANHTSHSLCAPDKCARIFLNTLFVFSGFLHIRCHTSYQNKNLPEKSNNHQKTVYEYHQGNM